MAKQQAAGKKPAQKTVVQRKAAGRKKAASAAAKRKKRADTKVRKKKVKQRAVKQRAVKQRAVKQKTVARKAAATRKKKAGKKQKSGKRAKQRSLGRPRVTADARLDQVFHKDYQAREVFDFLGVGTLRELETYAPDEIIDKLTAPMVQTVQRIRKTLAMVNRSLANDRDFALEFKSRL